MTDACRAGRSFLSLDRLPISQLQSDDRRQQLTGPGFPERWPRFRERAAPDRAGL